MRFVQHQMLSFFGAIGDPKYDNDPKAKVRPEQGLLRMRQKLGLFANVRPTFTFPSLVHKSPLKLERVDGVDFVFFRELTGGVYFGEPRGRNEQGTKAFDTNVYSKEEIVRLARMGFEAAQKAKETPDLCGQSQCHGHFQTVEGNGAGAGFRIPGCEGGI